VIGSSLVILPTEVDGVDKDDIVDEDDKDGEDDEEGEDGEDDEDCPIGHARMCCRSKPADGQRQAARRAGRLPGLLAGPVPRSTARDPAHILSSGLLGVPPYLVPDQEGVIC
jgi:hypothetical protein